MSDRNAKLNPEPQIIEPGTAASGACCRCHARSDTCIFGDRPIWMDWKVDRDTWADWQRAALWREGCQRYTPASREGAHEHYLSTWEPQMARRCMKQGIAVVANDNWREQEGGQHFFDRMQQINWYESELRGLFRDAMLHLDSPTVVIVRYREDGASKAVVLRTLREAKAFLDRQPPQRGWAMVIIEFEGRRFVTTFAK